MASPSETANQFLHMHAVTANIRDDLVNLRARLALTAEADRAVLAGAIAAAESLAAQCKALELRAREAAQRKAFETAMEARHRA